MMTQFLSKHCVLCLVLNVWKQEKNAEVCVAGFLPPSGRISAYFKNIQMKCSTHAYFEVRVRSILSKYENSKGIFL